MPNPYFVERMEAHGRLLDSIVAERGGIDVFFMGNSVTGTNADIRSFEQEMLRLTGKSVSGFNGWLVAVSPHQAFFYYRHFWRPRVSPRIVVFGVSYHDLLNLGRAEDFWLFKRGRFESLWLRNDRSARARAWLMQNVKLYYYKSFLPENLRDFRLPFNGPRGGPIDEYGMAIIGPKADVRKVFDFSTPEEGREIHGYAVVYETPPTRERCKLSLSTIREAARYCRQQGARFVLVNLPHHKARWQSPEGPAYYRSYLKLLEEVADSEDVSFIDVTDGDPSRYGSESFTMDHWHMNREAAEAFSKTLAGRLVETGILP